MKQSLKYIYERLLDNLKIAENKYSISIALASGVVVFGGTFLNQPSTLAKTLASACVVFALISVLYGFIALAAKKIRLPRHKKNKNPHNLMYFKDIIKYDEHSYVEEIKKRYNFPNAYKPDNMDYDLARQIISTAKILAIKYTYFNLSIIFLGISVIMGASLMIYLGAF